MENKNLDQFNTNMHKEDAYIRAQKRIKEIKGFYWHAFWFCAVNLFITISKLVDDISDGESFIDAFFEFGTFAVWIFWGVGLLAHGLSVFGRNIVFSKSWEERKIREFMDKEKRGWE